MDTVQPGILLPVPEHCLYLTLGTVPGTDPSPALMKLRDHGIGEGMVVGIGKSVVSALGNSVEGLRPLSEHDWPRDRCPCDSGHVKRTAQEDFEPEAFVGHRL